MKLSSTKGLIYLLLFTFGVIYVSSEAPQYSLDYDRYIFFHWKGALTSHSLLLRVFPHISELNDYNYDAYIVLNYKKRPAKTPSVVRIPFRKGDNPLSKLTLEPLKPHTTYKYGFIFVNKESNLTSKELGKIFNSNPHQEFTFTTLGLALTPFNFTFGAASCAQTGSVNDIFLSMHQANLNFFIHMGDMHYMNIVDNVTQEFDQAYYDVFSSPPQQVFFQGTPLFYVFDDHDFGKNDATGNSPSRYSANSAYRDFVPHSTLKNRLPRDDSAIFKRAPAAEQRNQSEYVTVPAADPNYGVFQSFIVGRCLFIMMDLRTFKDRNPGDILGDEQTAWLENQIRFAGYTSEIVQVFIVSSFSWIHNDTGSEWVPYPEVQQTIAGWINEHIVRKGKKMMMLSGDAHMVAFDDGTNNRFGGFSVVQAASLDQSPSCKGGPYSHGVSPGRGQYGNINVIDYGNDTICVQVSLRNVEGALISYDTCEPDKYPQNEMSCHEWNRH